MSPAHSLHINPPAPLGGRPLGAVRRLALLSGNVGDPEVVHLALAGELLSGLPADEVHIQHLAGGPDLDLVVAYSFGAKVRRTYVTSREERSGGTGWVVASGNALHAPDSAALAALAPSLLDQHARSALFIPMRVGGGRIETVVTVTRRSAEPFTAQACDLALTLVEQAAAALAHVRTRTEASTDPLTTCMNRRAMMQRLDEEVARTARYGSPLSCLLIDLDEFKRINDELGHAGGDAVLREVGMLLIDAFRNFDQVARLGGDEFVVILPSTGLTEAGVAAERFLKRLRATGTAASVGVVEWQPPMSASGLLDAADQQLMGMKRRRDEQRAREHENAWTDPAAR